MPICQNADPVRFMECHRGKFIADQMAKSTTKSKWKKDFNTFPSDSNSAENIKDMSTIVR